MAILNDIKNLPKIGLQIVKYNVDFDPGGDHIITVTFDDESIISFHYSYGDDEYLPKGEFNPEDYLDDSEKQAKEIAELKEEIARLKIQKQIAEDERDMAKRIRKIPYPDIPWPYPNPDGTKPWPEPDDPNPWIHPWPQPYDPYRPYIRYRFDGTGEIPDNFCITSIQFM